MAKLLDVKTKQPIYLFAHHNFGRLADIVDTQIQDAQISKHHMSITWQNNAWHIRDLSLNGTWVNKHRLTSNELTELHQGDEIYLADLTAPVFIVDDLSPPCDMLIPLGPSIADEIELTNYHLLPNEQQPQIALFFENQQWFMEDLNDDKHLKVALSENDIIAIKDQKWRLFTCRLAEQTQQAKGPQYSLAQLKFIFDLSLDEEHTKLAVHAPDTDIDLDTRIHHYLTLNLARSKNQDADKGLALDHQGWLYPQQLMKDLGVDYCHLNILIHRARKQFSDAINVCDSHSFIERHNGKLRFGGLKFQIKKDSQIECEL